MHRFRRAMIVLFSVAGVSACERKEVAVPPPSGMPALSNQPTPPAGHAPLRGNPHGGDPHGGNPHGGNPHGGNPHGGNPHGEGAHPITGAMPGGEYDPSATIRGRLEIDDGLRDKVAQGDVLFLVARVEDGSERGGPILGVKRLTVGRWPQPFELDGRDAMSPGTKFAGRVVLTARVDKDGDPISKNPGDAVGVARTEVGDGAVRLKIDTLTK